jgi:hypothetical protein
MLSCEYQGRKLIVDDEDLDWLRKSGKNGELLCPECKEVVLLRKGTYFRPHFYHYRNSNCALSNESEEHREAKRFILNLLLSKYGKENVFLEEIVESRQRVDVLLNMEGKKFAFEIQFSEQDNEKWVERNTKFKDINVVPIWILGYRKPIKELCVSHLKEYDNNELISHLSIKLGRTRQNAAQVVDDWRKGTAYLFDKSPSGVHIYHILTTTREGTNLYLGYLKPSSKTVYYGDIACLGNNWEFSSHHTRFIPTLEIEYNNRKKQIQELNEKRRFARKELQEKVLELTKSVWLKDIPEIAVQEGRIPLPGAHIFCSKYSPDGFEGRLLAEIGIYLKYIKNQKQGFTFTFQGQIRPFLEKWGFITPENQRFAFAQIGSFLAHLRNAGILEKIPSSDQWRVTGKKIDIRK